MLFDCTFVHKLTNCLSFTTATVALQRAELRVVRWMCGVKLQDRVPSKELRGRLELEDII